MPSINSICSAITSTFRSQTSAQPEPSPFSAALSSVSNRALVDLATPPRFVKPHETQDNKFKLNISEFFRNEQLKTPLKSSLDKNVNYLWLLSYNAINKLPELVIGYENADCSGNRYGHPTLAIGGLQDDGTTSYQKGFIAGELFYKNNEWHIDNNSGRFGSGNVTAMRNNMMGKADLMDMARATFLEQTDLAVSTTKIYSRHNLKRALQGVFPVLARQHRNSLS
jgi:hypothetical protein